MQEERAGLAERLALYLDKGSGEPLFRQIADRVWLEVVSGTLETGERLPTVRQFAIDLGVPPGTVERAYEELERLGLLVRRPGGTFITLSSPDTPELERRAQLERLCRELLERAETLGFSPTELMDTLTDLRSEGWTHGARRPE
jgi:GntR family transcriptional regulator